MTVLRMGFHSVTGRRIVEIYDNDDAMVGVIYPADGDNGIHVVSKFFRSVTMPATDLLTPGILITFLSKDRRAAND